MSKETFQWLNENVMFGCIDTRKTWGPGTSFGNGEKPWFADENYQHAYGGPIPAEDVIENLFYWQAREGDLTVRIPVGDIEVADGLDDNGEPYKNMIVPNKKAIIRPDTNLVMGVFSDGYQVHNYEPWFLDVTKQLVDGELGISSAGLLRGGAQAWVSLELPDDVEVAGAGHIRPCIIAASSMDGSLATTYATRVMRPECDNSLHWSLAAEGGTFKVKHSSRSMNRLDEARSALGIIYQMTEQAEQWFNKLADVDVTDAKFRSIIANMVPIPDPDVRDGKVKNQRGITIAETKHTELWNLWSADDRAAPWRGTLAGAYHAVNTWNEHMVPQDDNLVRRQMSGTLNGTFDAKDREFWRIVEQLDIVVPDVVGATV